ncbi:hypothetical protein Emed_006089 [Eimeria media]
MSSEAEGNRDVGERADGPKEDPSDANATRLTQDAADAKNAEPGDLDQEHFLAQSDDKEANQPKRTSLGKRALQAAQALKRRSTRKEKDDEEGNTQGDRNLDKPPDDLPDRPLVGELGAEAGGLGGKGDTEGPDLADRPEALSKTPSFQPALGNSNGSLRRRSVSQTSAARMHSRLSNASNGPLLSNTREAQGSIRSAINGGASQAEQAEEANNSGAHIWEMSEESSQEQQDASDEAAEDSRRDRSRETLSVKP